MHPAVVRDGRYVVPDAPGLLGRPAPGVDRRRSRSRAARSGGDAADRAARSARRDRDARRARRRAARQHVRRARRRRRGGDGRRGVGRRASATSTPRRSTATACPSAGSARALRGDPRDEFVLSTKVGRVLEPDPDVDPGDLPGASAASSRGSTTPATACCVRSRRASTGSGSTGSTSCSCTIPTTTRTTRSRGAFPALRRAARRRASCGRSARDEPARDARTVRRAGRPRLRAARRSLLAARPQRRGRSSTSARRAASGVILGGVFNSGVLATDVDPRDLRLRARVARDPGPDRAPARGVRAPRGAAPGRRARLRAARIRP